MHSSHTNHETAYSGDPNSHTSPVVEWDFSGGQITPRLTGYLHLDEVAGNCARMRIDYYADDGAVGGALADTDAGVDHLETKYGGEVCVGVADDSHRRWSVNLGSYSHHLIDHIKISIQWLEPNGDYQSIDDTTSFFGY